jgi:hypothetical protein
MVVFIENSRDRKFQVTANNCVIHIAENVARDAKTTARFTPAADAPKRKMLRAILGRNAFQRIFQRSDFVIDLLLATKNAEDENEKNQPDNTISGGEIDHV